ncbi:MAG: imidazoleglycerol-phosphate dehydratase [Candidatus Nezhaarchaeota archaeon]|nr:imidazoleglycerol-phosphate dehydratase [Candidatus Nezhaarchaeota archaeon]
MVRETREARVEVEVDLDGEGRYDVSVEPRFLKHMLETLARHSLIDLKVRAAGDLAHHVVEDVALALGEAVDRALGERAGIARFGFSYAPMDEALARAAVDLGGRGYANVKLELRSAQVEDVASSDVAHFLKSLASAARATLHVEVLYGSDDHHKVEAAFKSLALALRMAASLDPRIKGVLSVKEKLS